MECRAAACRPSSEQAILNHVAEAQGQTDPCIELIGPDIFARSFDESFLINRAEVTMALDVSRAPNRLYWGAGTGGGQKLHLPRWRHGYVRKSWIQPMHEESQPSLCRQKGKQL
jgi:hypothetical protein